MLKPHLRSHRGFIITDNCPSLEFLGGQYQWRHPDYTGTGDQRRGSGHTYLDCIADLDRWIETNNHPTTKENQ